MKYIELFNMKSWSNPVLPPHLVSSNFNLIKCSLCLDVGSQPFHSFSKHLFRAPGSSIRQQKKEGGDEETFEKAA